MKWLGWGGRMALACLCAACLILGCAKSPAQRPIRTVAIAELKGPDWEDYVGRVAEVEGIFVRDPLPMLVTDLDMVLANMPMPEEQYLLLVGEAADDIDPQGYGGAKLRVRGTVVGASQIAYEGQHVALSVSSYEMLARLTPYAPQ
jgi:hypothetical protein